ncbi:MAG TPA: hypothetical protein VGE02_01895 [Gemmatimonadales bacterium]
MAEIPVERKSGSKAWLWLLVIAVLALLAWMLFGRDEEPEPVPVGAAQATSPALAASPAAPTGAWSIVIAA